MQPPVGSAIVERFWCKLRFDPCLYPVLLSLCAFFGTWPEAQAAQRTPRLAARVGQGWGDGGCCSAAPTSSKVPQLLSSVKAPAPRPTPRNLRRLRRMADLLGLHTRAR
ncbi:hypothetical protein HC891_11600 [Candidatus Gracilibacteria bacterium]|nr:hypothetical protein [Candidatus Gracilibacteria bacterium]